MFPIRLLILERKFVAITFIILLFASIASMSNVIGKLKRLLLNAEKSKQESVT